MYCEKRIEICFRNANRPSYTMNHQLVICDPSVHCSRRHIELESNAFDGKEYHPELLICSGPHIGSGHDASPESVVPPLLRATEADIHASKSL
jgi:hypothetical protein